MKTCYIFGDADICDYSKINIPPDAFLIAADGGYRHFAGLDKAPDLLIGDFDSFVGDLPSSCEIIKSPAEKDDTDMLLAVKTALERGFDDITLCGALGGRLDHTFANIQTLEYILSRGANARIEDSSGDARILTEGSYRFPRNNGYFSVFAVSEKASVTVTGTKYCLDDYSLSRSFPLGVSNEISEDICEIIIHSGVLLVISADN